MTKINLIISLEREQGEKELLNSAAALETAAYVLQTGDEATVVKYLEGLIQQIKVG